MINRGFNKELPLGRSSVFRALLTTVLVLASLSGTASAGPKGAIGDLYVVSGNTNEIIQYDGITCKLVGVFASAGLNGPRDLAFGPNGNLFVVNINGRNVIEYDGSTGNLIGTFADEGMNTPAGMTFIPKGSLLIGNWNSSQITKYDSTTGQYLGVFASGFMTGHAGIRIGPNGNIFVSNVFGDAVGEYAPSGAFLGDFVVFGSGGLDKPEGIAFGPEGDLFVSSSNTDSVIRYDGVTGVSIGTFAAGGGLSRPWGLDFSPSGDLFVASFDSNSVLVYDGATGDFIRSINDGGLTFPSGLTFKPDPLPPLNHLEVKPWPLVAKQMAAFTVTNVLPEKRTWLLYTLNGIGDGTFIRALNVVVDLENPKLALEPKKSDEAGFVKWVARMPSVPRSLPVWFQCVQPLNVTNFVETLIEPR